MSVGIGAQIAAHKGDLARGGAAGLIGGITALGAVPLMALTATLESSARLATDPSALAQLNNMALFSVGGTVGVGIAMGAGYAAFKAPELAAGFKSLIMERSLADRFLDLTGHKARRERKMDRMIKKADSFSVQIDGNDPVALVYPINKYGNPGKPMLMEMDEYNAFLKKMRSSDLIVEQTNVEANGSRTKRTQRGLPHCVGKVDGIDVIKPSSERIIHGEYDAMSYFVQGKFVHPAFAGIPGVENMQDACPMTQKELLAHDSDMGITQAVAADKKLLHTAGLINMDMEYLSGATHVLVNETTGIDGKPAHEIYVANRDANAPLALIGKLDDADHARLLGVLAATNLEVDHAKNNEITATTKNGINLESKYSV